MRIARSQVPRLVLPFVIIHALAGCDGGEAPVSTAVVDTLANGAVRVVNIAAGRWDATATQPWQLVEDLRIGRLDGDGPDVFGTVRSVFPDRSGRIWVMDSSARALHLFDADGKFVRTVGRPGDGPGDISTNSCAFVGPDGDVWVEGGRRLQRFDSTGVLLGGMPVTHNCTRRFWTPDGRYVVYTGGAFVEHRLSEAGEPTAGDTFPPPSLPDPPTVTWRRPGSVSSIRSALPFWPRGTFAESHAGDFWVSDGGSPYTFRRQSLAGDTLMLVERPYEPVPIDQATWEAAARREGYVADEPYDPDQIPRTYPPFDLFHPATDGTLWVFRTVEGGATGLDVFAPDGRYLGAAGLPPDFERTSIRVVTDEHMYGVVRDDLDVQYVVRLRVVRP